MTKKKKKILIHLLMKRIAELEECELFHSAEELYEKMIDIESIICVDDEAQ